MLPRRREQSDQRRFAACTFREVGGLIRKTLGYLTSFFTNDMLEPYQVISWSEKNRQVGKYTYCTCRLILKPPA